MAVHTRGIPLLLVLATLSWSSGEEVPEPRPPSRTTGTYLGLTPPGIIPEVFAPGLVSTEANEGGVVVDPRRHEIYFWVVRDSRGGGEARSTIYATTERDGEWSRPEVVPFSGQFSDSYIALHPDGSRLYFQSDRPIDPSESTYRYNIWFADREGRSWSRARPIGRPINGSSHTGGASVTVDGTLYFTRMDLESGSSQIYESRLVNGAYQEPERLPDAVNSRFQTCDSYVAPDESYLVFTAFERQGHDFNPGRLYLAFREPEGTWTAAQEMGPTINSEDQFGSVTISPDGRYLFFPRFNHAEGTGLDIYWVDSGAGASALAPVTPGLGAVASPAGGSPGTAHAATAPRVP